MYSTVYVQDEAAQLHGNYIVTVAWIQRLVDSAKILRFKVLLSPPCKIQLGKTCHVTADKTVLRIVCIICGNRLSYPQAPCSNSNSKCTALLHSSPAVKQKVKNENEMKEKIKVVLQPVEDWQPLNKDKMWSNLHFWTYAVEAEPVCFLTGRILRLKVLISGELKSE